MFFDVFSVLIFLLTGFFLSALIFFEWWLWNTEGGKKMRSKQDLYSFVNGIPPTYRRPYNKKAIFGTALTCLMSFSWIISMFLR